MAKPQQPRQQHQHGHAGQHEDEQQPAVAGEQSAQGEHRAEVGDEARGQDELAQVMPVQTGLDHHRVDDGHRGGAERHPADLGRMQLPAEYQQAERECAHEWQQEGGQPDRHARLPVPAQ
jgi:hypothetical protein